MMVLTQQASDIEIAEKMLKAAGKVTPEELARAALICIQAAMLSASHGEQSHGQHIEEITWHDAQNHKPDPDTSVLCCREEDFFIGYWDDEDNGWISNESGGIISDVLYWADPNGPQ
jgi:hypothetical protein